jgi:methionyl-tRNA formyltransferase
MKKLETTIVFFGNERIATGISTDAPILNGLIQDGYTVAAVIVNQAESTMRGNKQVLEVAEIAKNNNIPLLSPKKPDDIYKELTELGASIAVLVAYGKILPLSVIDVFPKGIINVHPSLLPKYRGSTPIESVLLNGDHVTGVTIMKLAQEMDAGPIYAQSTINLTGTETKQGLADTLSELGAAMISNLLPGIANGEVVALDQDNSAATFSSLLSKNDGVINCKKEASELEREVRAFSGWPKSRTSIAGIDCAITKVSVNNKNLQPGVLEITSDKTLLMGCSVGSLEIIELQPAGKNKMPVSAFLNGYGHLI